MSSILPALAQRGADTNIGALQGEPREFRSGYVNVDCPEGSPVVATCD